MPKVDNRVATVTGENPRNQNGGRTGGRGRGRGRIARAFGRGQGRNAHAHATLGKPTLGESEERATLYAAIDNPGPQRQFAVIKTLATHQGTKFNLLIDCGSTHSLTKVLAKTTFKPKISKTNVGRISQWKNSGISTFSGNP